MIEEGTQAPDFTLRDQDGNDVTLSDLRGRTVVLYFYPKADTPGGRRRDSDAKVAAPTGTSHPNAAIRARRPNASAITAPAVGSPS